MSATPTPTTPTPTVAGTQAPSQIDLLWDRYRKPFYVVVALVLGALGVKYGLGYLKDKERDTTWSWVSSITGLEGTYGTDEQAGTSLTERLMDLDIAKLKAGQDSAPAAVKPYILMELAKRAILDKDWATAESMLKSLETAYPNHTLVKQTPHPVQIQDVVKKDPPEKTSPQPPPKQEKPEWKPPVAGSTVTRVRAEIEAAKLFQTPAHFAKAEIPADATKVKFELSGTYGSFVIALMPEAKLEREAFLKLAEANHWKDIAIDEIRRPAKTFKQPHEMHLGFESTKDNDRTKWTDTEPSKHQLAFVKNSLSHFAGAVSARVEAEGKSCADRFWINFDDAPANDGDRVVFGFVVEGLENIKKVCEVTMTTEEEGQGRGKPSETIRVTAVTVIK